MTVANRSTANRLIGQNGQAVTIDVVTGPGTYDPATGTATPSTATIETVGVVFPLSKSRKVDGTLIKQGDETMLLSAIDASGATYAMPAVDSVVTLADGSKRAIIAVDELAPAGLPIMFDAVVRRLS